MELTELPLIDVTGFESRDWYPALDRACSTWGCFQIVGHGVDMALLGEMQNQMRRFFALDRERKLAIERSADNPWGYFDRELTKNKRDLKEIFDYGPPASVGPLRGAVPQWPADLPGFRPALEAFYVAAEQVAAGLLAGISSNLGMAPDYLGRGFGPGHTSFLRLNYYPVCDAPADQLGISHHTDAGAVTVLLADAEPGLQFQHDGCWHTVAPLAGALTVNIGDIVQVWSNDRYTAPLHWVLASADRPRYSAPFFYNPSYEMDYAPLPGVVGPSAPARYRPINWGEFRAARAAGDYADYGDEVQIAQFRR